jgi:hypothetical protein
VLWDIDKTNAMATVRQESRTAFHRLENTLLFLNPQISVNLAASCDQSYQGSGFMNVELVNDKNPLLKELFAVLSLWIYKFALLIIVLLIGFGHTFFCVCWLITWNGLCELL